jgi:hypothetical protein
VSGLHSGDDDPFGFAVAPPGFDGAAVDPGEILVTDFGSGGADEIWVFSPDVAEGEAFLASTTGMNVYDLASGTNGMVYGGDALDGDNLRVIAADGTVTDLALSQDIGSPSSLVFDPDSGDLFVATQRPTGDAVYRVDPSTGTVGFVRRRFRRPRLVLPGTRRQSSVGHRRRLRPDLRDPAVVVQ